MKRKNFLKTLALLPLTSMMKANTLEKIADNFEYSDRMPVLFLGHGSPMNAIEENEFVRGFKEIGKNIQKPNAVLCISAHWETKGTMVTAMQQPPTIHDFGGFPKELFEVQYPAPGSPELAKETQTIIKSTAVGLDHHWGLDHGAWSVIKHLYPNADVPVIQMSMDYTKGPQYHYDLGRELSDLRNKGILIIGSGNIVHNLRMAAFDKMHEDNYGFDWAHEVKEKVNRYMIEGNHEALIHYHKQGSSFNLAIPSPEHYLPLLYALALQNKNESVTLYNDKALAGSLSMTSVKIEKA